MPVADRIGYWTAPFHETGAIEGEGMRPLTVGADAAPQAMYAFGPNEWSGNSQLLWKAKQGGDKLELEFPVVKPGKYHLMMRFTKAPDYGTVQVSLDKKNIGGPNDLYDPKVVLAKTVDLGEVEVTKGPHKLGIEMTGRNAESRGYLFGFDYIALEPAK